ncbi:MAG: hypothetical protein KatS3mg093_029 [Candidatus Parcubacteria bacterium]|nr:MAG: hypothetical protein KatS3mg093_029 [Candidatus Parcubacteria bacterium]
MRKYYLLYFLLPFFIWFLIYWQKADFVIIFKRPIWENSLIIPIEDLWQIILVFSILQFGNDILARFFKNYNIFVKINLVFIFFHFLVAVFIFVLNFS